MVIETARLTLVPASIALARAEVYDRAEFARLLGVEVPNNWPPAWVADALPIILEWIEAAPERLGWFAWYALARPPEDEGAAAVLVGGGGFMGPPFEGEVRVGYSVLPQFQGRGYATEMLGGLVRWSLAQPGVVTLVAETEWANPASERVLLKSGFRAAGTATDPAGRRFERRHPGGVAPK